MRTQTRIALFASAMLLYASCPLVIPVAAQTGTTADSARQQFARNYIAAVQSKDPTRVRQLLHPQLLACINASNREYFDFLINHDVEEAPRGKYDISITPVEHEMVVPGAPPRAFKYPVHPSYQVQINWEPRPNSSVTIIRTIAANNGEWFLVYPCANAEGARLFRENLEKGRAQREHARELASEIKDPLLTQLKTLVGQGQRIDAVKKYQSATGADLTTAVQVINALE
ncbi:MAG TPA: hypothetical protein VEG30_13565 [Terriglobales bacterium]|nr:hypothetical protein [Terriglobales bacterium]